MHSDNGNFKSNAYTTFQNLQANNAAIRRGQKGVPFIWSNLNAVSYTHLDVYKRQRMAPTTNPEEGYVNGQNLQALNESKGWYREGKHLSLIHI